MAAAASAGVRAIRGIETASFLLIAPGLTPLGSPSQSTARSVSADRVEDRREGTAIRQVVQEAEVDPHPVGAVERGMVAEQRERDVEPPIERLARGTRQRADDRREARVVVAPQRLAAFVARPLKLAVAGKLGDQAFNRERGAVHLNEALLDRRCCRSSTRT